MSDQKPRAPLDAYGAKRDFAKTPEPGPADGPRPKVGKKSAVIADGGNRFVIQKHFARRLHYDLRLEINGVLASWAVTKGISLDTKVKRLAVRTEDHPLDYATFEGEIPDGQYGAGVVEIWDRGTFEPLKGIDPEAGLTEGHLKFALKGERLRGGFALVRTGTPKAGRKGSGPRSGKTSGTPREHWLLIKEKDSAATSTFDPTDTWIGSVGPAPGKKAARPKPAFEKPQLATAVDRPPSGDNWVHEIKYDGYRLQAVKDKSSTRLFTRGGQDWTSKLTTIKEAVAALPRDQIVLDGELVVFDDQGNADFSALQKDLSSGAKNAVFVVFDCLQIGGRDLKPESWQFRNGELRAVLAEVSAPLKYSGYLTGDGREIFNAAVKLGAEGIVSKHIERPWRSGRNRGWLKIKGEHRGIFVVGGYRKSKSRPFASLLLGSLDGRRLVYRGRVGTGFSDKTLTSLAASLKPLEVADTVFIDVPDRARRDTQWTAPELAVEIAYTEETSGGHLRHPKFIRVADELPRTTRSRPKGTRLTNVDRILYPQAGYTKGDLLDYYHVARHHLFPQLAGRYVSLVRAPDGNLDKAFFQRHEFAGMPDTIEATQKLGPYNKYLSIKNEEGLYAAAQFSVLEFHIWGARHDSIEYPDRLVFDLDPDEALPFTTVRAAARLLRDVLEAGALTSFPLLTGGKGVHVIAPLDETADWDKVSGFARTLARQLVAAERGLFVATAGKSKRKNRIYIDWLRNKKTATSIAPWSPRARPGAPVAVPVSWSELARAKSGAAYDLGKARRRIASLRSDPWKGYAQCDQSVPDF